MNHVHTLVILLLGGILLYFAGGLWIVVLAIRRNFWYGIACFFLPVLQVLYVGMNWREGRAPFFIQLAGMLMMLLASLIAYLQRGR